MTSIKRIFIFTLFHFFAACLFSSAEFDEIKAAYEKKDYIVVIRLFENINKKDSSYLMFEKPILLMTARSYAEVVESQPAANWISNKLGVLFEQLLYLDHNIKENDLYSPEVNKSFFFSTFQRVREGLFGKLFIKVNKPGIEIKIDDQSSFYSSDSIKEFAIDLWIGRSSKKDFIIDSVFDYDFYKRKQPKLISIRSGESKKLSIKCKPVLLSNKPIFFSIALAQNYSMLSDKVFDDKLNFVQPWKDFAGIELGVGFKNRYYISGKFDKMSDLINISNKWNVQPKMDYLDHEFTNTELTFESSMFGTQYFFKPIGIRLGYRNIKLDFTNFKGRKTSAEYNLVLGGVFFSTRTEKRNDFFSRINFEGLAGRSEIGRVLGNNNSDSFGIGIGGSGEIGYSHNTRFDVSIGIAGESIWSNHNSDNISLLNFYLRCAVRI